MLRELIDILVKIWILFACCVVSFYVLIYSHLSMNVKTEMTRAELRGYYDEASLIDGIASAKYIDKSKISLNGEGLNKDDFKERGEIICVVCNYDMNFGLFNNRLSHSLEIRSSGVSKNTSKGYLKN